MRTLRKVGSEKAITLVALVVTIVILLILAGVSIPMLTGTNGILTQAQKAKLSTELSSYKEQLELYKTEKLSENRDFLESTLTVGKESLTYNTQPEGETGNIKTVIPNIKDEYIDKVEIINKDYAEALKKLNKEDVKVKEDSQYYWRIIAIKEWMEENNTTRPPRCQTSSKTIPEKEGELGTQLSNIRRFLILPYIELENEEDKEAYKEEHPEIEHVMGIVEWIDKNNIKAKEDSKDYKKILEIKNKKMQKMQKNKLYFFVFN